ncbi:iron-containing redox enzyme family protein [Polyangium aurulentum]|uniref:iron-containing redox enzyme family protein n=1 Tax=Polyangium aurulentum TaxID=2567896 RepID=UPI0010AE6C67|nr:iron-containing redox enzyme family protein [Polyangium aurulentum]UQA57815.1 hypothetical protein E8A73_042150 [Polyangium aurulentum]
MGDAEVRWARVAPGTLIVATRERAFLASPDAADQPSAFLDPDPGPASLEATAKLLDAAIGAGQRAAPPRQSPPALTPLRWAYRLAGYYHTTHATPRLMAEAERRFAAQGRGGLAAWAGRKVRDEGGHDLLALRDLAALGYDGPALVRAIVPPAPAALVDSFESLVGEDDPVGSVGYAYALERLATTRDGRYLAAVRAVLPEGVDATRCLRVHSATGTDEGHVEDIIAVAASLSHEERERIAAAAYRTTLLAASPPTAAILSEEELALALAPFRILG